MHVETSLQAPLPSRPPALTRSRVRTLLEHPQPSLDAFCRRWGRAALLHLPDDELVQRAMLLNAATRLAARAPTASAVQSLVMLRAFRDMAIDFLGGREGRAVIGRGPEAELRMSHESVSKKHASLDWAPGGTWVHDFNSLNGTHLNGVAVREPAALEDGDLLRLGDATLVFVTSPTLYLQLESVRHSSLGDS